MPRGEHERERKVSHIDNEQELKKKADETERRVSEALKDLKEMDAARKERIKSETQLNESIEKGNDYSEYEMEEIASNSLDETLAHEDPSLSADDEEKVPQSIVDDEQTVLSAGADVNKRRRI